METVRQWTFSYITMAPSEKISDEYIAQELASNRGCHDSHTDSLVDDEEFQPAAREFVLKNAKCNGDCNLTCKMFAEWVQNNYNIAIHNETARQCIQKLGFCWMHHHKGVYFDGHDREDVVTYRKQFLETNGGVRQNTLYRG